MQCFVFDNPSPSLRAGRKENDKRGFHIVGVLQDCQRVHPGRHLREGRTTSLLLVKEGANSYMYAAPLPRPRLRPPKAGGSWDGPGRYGPS